MNKTDLIKKALAMAKEAHAGQRDSAGKDYFTGHILTVFKMVGASPIELGLSAILHDVVEDSDIMVEDIRKEFGDKVADAVDALTHRKGVHYDAYLNRVASNPIARRVKIADMTHNSDITRIQHPTPYQVARVEKYRKAIESLK